MEKGRFQMMVQMLADIHSVNKAAEGCAESPFHHQDVWLCVDKDVWLLCGLQVGDGEEKIHIDGKTELYVIPVQYV